MRIFDRVFALLFSLLVAIAPAAADTSTERLTITGWQAIGTGSMIVQALSQEGVYLLDADATPTAETGAVLISYGDKFIAPPAKSTWYAHAANSKTTTTIGVVNVAAGSGGSVTANLGALNGAATAVKQDATISAIADAGAANFGFTPISGSSVSITTTAARSAIPAGSSMLVVYNLGATEAYVALGDSGVTATTTSVPVLPRGWQAFRVGSATHVSYVTASGTGAANVIGGTGVPVGSGAAMQYVNQSGVWSVYAAPGYLSTQTPVGASTTGAASQITAGLPAQAGKTTYVTGIEITGGGATAATIVTATITGLAAQRNYDIAVPAGANVGVGPLIIQFDPPLPAVAANTAITLTVPSFGAGNTKVSASIRGYQQ